MRGGVRMAYIIVPWLENSYGSISNSIIVSNGVVLGVNDNGWLTYVLFNKTNNSELINNPYYPEIRLFKSTEYDYGYISIIALDYSVGYRNNRCQYKNGNTQSYLYGSSSFPDKNYTGTGETFIAKTTKGLSISIVQLANWTIPSEYLDLNTYPNVQSAIDDIWDGKSSVTPITYIPINSTITGPTEAESGSIVIANVTFPDGYNIKHTGEGGGISVYNQDGAIPFSYENGQITFTMP